MSRGSVKGTGYPLHSPISTLLPLPCATVCHHIATGLYCWWYEFRNKRRTSRCSGSVNVFTDSDFITWGKQMDARRCYDNLSQNVLSIHTFLPYCIPFYMFRYFPSVFTSSLFILCPGRGVNPLASEFFLILAHPVYKMWIIQEPNKLALWNKLHFEEKKNGEYRACLKYSVHTFVE